MSILDLPTELILQVAAYLDWSTELCPTKPDIFSLSTTCSQIREAIIPLVFKDVTFRLRWQDGALVEPYLYKLRLHYPDIAEHIRSVCIRTNFEDDGRNPQGPQNLNVFAAPKGRPDWLDLSSDVCPESNNASDEIRRRANKAARRIVSSEDDAQQDSEMTTAETIIERANAQLSKNRAEIDALTIAMLCIPRKTNKIVFVSLRQRDWSNARNRFAARVAAAALNLFQHNIEDLTFVSNVSSRDLRTNARVDPNAPEVENRILSPDLITTLAPRRLVLATSDTASRLIGSPMLSTLRLDVWHNASHAIRTLELKNISSDPAQLLKLVQGFVSLKELSLRSIVLQHPRGHHRTQNDDPLIWLLFCIDIRNALRHTLIELEDLEVSIIQDNNKLPLCAVAWLRDMAIPAGAVIDFERNERLMEDFQSFLPMWNAEQEEHRGVMALKEWDSELGRNLCDAAMSRRWR